MKVQVYDFIGLIFLYPWWSFFIFFATFYFLKIFFGLFIGLPEKMPFWFYAYKTFFFYSVVASVSILIMSVTIFSTSQEHNPLKDIKDRDILIPCAEYIIVTETENGYGVPLVSSFPLRQCINLKQGERMTGIPLSDLAAEKSNETFINFLTKTFNNITIEKIDGKIKIIPKK